MSKGVRQQNLVLILAKELADKLATAMFIVDHEGTLVYFNERAGDVLGATFAETGRMPLNVWASRFTPVDADGRPLPSDDLPLVMALTHHQPAHRAFRITGADREVREIAVTAVPLFARPDEFVGAAAIFWEHSPPRAGAPS